ncbi:MAG: hypothetical protein ACJ788_26885, partial [Ktedonobacteraceae bacterium]
FISNEKLTRSSQEYAAYMGYYTQSLMAGTDYAFLSTEQQQQYDKYLDIIYDRVFWQVNWIRVFVALGIRRSGNILEKEPLYVQSHTYKDVEFYRRTYSDVRDELTTKLVSLPPYQAICSLVSNAGELPIQIKTLPPLQIRGNSNLEAQVKTIRERCQKELGHPWQEVYKEMQTRQNLPPAKSHVPQQKP